MKLADRVKETTTTTGTGTLTLAGAVAGFRTFLAALTDGDLVPYVIEASNAADWETGIGTYSAGTLARTTVTASSNAGSALDLAAGTHTVYLGMIARSARDIDYIVPVSITTTTALTAAAIGRHHVCTGTTADYTVSLPTSGLAVGDLLSLEMSSALTKMVTLDAGVSATIDGERYRILWARENCTLKWDGTQWAKVAGRSIPMTAKITHTIGTSTNVSLPDDSQVKFTLDTAAGESVAGMIDTPNRRLIVKRPGNYSILTLLTVTGNNATGLTALSADLTFQIRLHKNGSYADAESCFGRSGSSVQFYAPLFSTVAAVAGDYFEAFGYRLTLGAAQTCYMYSGSIAIAENVTW